MPEGRVFNTPLQMQALKSLCASVVGLVNVGFGIPTSYTNRVSVSITVGPQIIDRKTVGATLARFARYQITWAYRVVDKAQVEAAELELAAYLDAFAMALYTDVTLNGSSQNASIEGPPGDDPTYPVVAGQEYREYVMIVVLNQQAVISH